MQVANFGETDNEWQVKRILSHIGHGDATTFKVKWTSGDTTWLPADQVVHLSALTDYLDLLEAESVDKLPIGEGQQPTDDPQLNCGMMFLGASDLTPSNLRPMSSPLVVFHKGNRITFCDIHHNGDSFVLHVNEPFCPDVRVPCEHMQHCLEYSMRI